jgi:hypothetical protein
MKRMLLVAAVLLVTSLAFAAPPTTYNFTFNGFCDGMSLTLGTGAQMSNVPGPKIFVAGVHNGCSSFYSSGFKHGTSTLIPPYKTPVLDVADGEGNTLSTQYLVQPTPSCVWANYYNFDGVHNYNYLSGSCTLGAVAPSGVEGRSTTPFVK